MGLYLPLRVLAYEDQDGKTWLIYENPAQAAIEHGVPGDHPAVLKMAGALTRITAAGAGAD